MGVESSVRGCLPETIVCTQAVRDPYQLLFKELCLLEVPCLDFVHGSRS